MVILGLVVLLLGWGVGADVLRRVAPNYPAMVPATALTLVIGGSGGLSLFLVDKKWVLVVSVFAILCILVLENTLGLTPTGGSSTDAMSMASFSCAILLVVDFFARIIRRANISVAADTIGLIVCSIIIIGYIFNSAALYKHPLYTQMALHTAGSFFAVFSALLLLDPARSWVRVLIGVEAGSQMVRRVLPVVIVVPIALSLIAAEAVFDETTSPEFRFGVLSFLIIVSTFTAVVYFADATNRAERRKMALELAFLESERRRQEVELAAARSAKIAALGTMVGGVAHDFNNTLSVILGELELLEAVRPEDPGRRHVAQAIRAVHHAAALTKQLLAYGRKSQLNPVLLNADEAISPALRMFTRVCPANILVDRKLGHIDALFRADIDALQQAILNVLINARDALPDGGRITVATQVERLEITQIEQFHGAETLKAGTYVVIRIEDTGSGMAAETVDRATDPFFTTKETGEGTGLGLSTVEGFCRQSEGGLRIDSILGTGTTVVMAFPVIAEDDSETERD